MTSEVRAEKEEEVESNKFNTHFLIRKAFKFSRLNENLIFILFESKQPLNFSNSFWERKKHNKTID